MSTWFGRGLLIVAALVGAFLALPDAPTAELSRFVPVVATREAPTTAGELPTRAGSLDQIASTPEGLLVEGWVGRDVDEITIVVGPTVVEQEQKVLLFARPDVTSSGGGLFTGFRTVLPGLEESDARCIVFQGPTGSAVMRSRGAGDCG